jgi:DNA-binding transcriptional MerR regulator
MKLLDISEVSARAGMAPSALRYYEEIGLIASAGRRGLRRQFGPEALLQLSLIAMGQAAGFSLEEIRGMFGKDGRANVPRSELRAKADDLDHQIRRLTALRDTLRHVADCPAPSHLECPKFQRLMRFAGRAKPPSRRRLPSHR